MIIYLGMEDHPIKVYPRTWSFPNSIMISMMITVTRNPIMMRERKPMKAWVGEVVPIRDYIEKAQPGKDILANEATSLK